MEVENKRRKWSETERDEMKNNDDGIKEIEWSS